MISSRPSTSAASAADPRSRPSLSRAEGAGFQEYASDIALGLPCLLLGPLIYAASLATVAALLGLACAALIGSRHDSASILAGATRLLAAFVPLLVWMLMSATWSLDSAASVEVTLRVAVLFLSGSLLVAGFARLPLEQLKKSLIALALGLSAAAAVVVVDLALGGHLARYLYAPRLDGVDPALGYGRAATLHAMFFAPVLIGLLRCGFRRLAVGFALLAAAAIMETSSLSAKTALTASLLVLVAVWLVPWLRWLGLGGVGVALGFGPIIFNIWRLLSDRAYPTRPAQATIAATTAAAAAVGLISFGIWQEWFLSGLFIAAACTVLCLRQSAAAARRQVRPEWECGKFE